MSTHRYIYNRDTCSFERVFVSRVDRLLNVLRFFLVCCVLSGFMYKVHGRYFDSAKEIRLKRENEVLRNYYDELRAEVENLHSDLSVLQRKDDDIHRMLLNINAIPEAIRQAGMGGTNKYFNLESHGECISEAARRVDQLRGRLSVQSGSYREIIDSANDRLGMLSCIPAICPIYNDDLICMTSPFGIRIDPVLGVPRMHKGVDYFAPKGTPIYATGDGVVILAKMGWNGGFGNFIMIKHGYGYITKYCHQSRFNVRRGDRVKRGECIGFVGATGKATGPHLHYEVIRNRKKVNPADYILTGVTAADYRSVMSLVGGDNN